MPFRDVGIWPGNSPVALLHADKRADRNFREEFASSVLGQSDAAVRRRMIRHVPRVHSKIETTQSHEIRHVHMVDRGTMVSFLVGDHKFAPFRRITWSASRTLRAIHRHAVLKEGDP